MDVERDLNVLSRTASESSSVMYWDSVPQDWDRETLDYALKEIDERDDIMGFNIDHDTDFEDLELTKKVFESQVHVVQVAVRPEVAARRSPVPTVPPSSQSSKRTASDMSVGSDSLEGPAKRLRVGHSLTPVLLAHDPRVNKLFTKLKVPIGVQWEIARFVSLKKFEWSDVTEERLLSLCTGNVQAANVPRVFGLVSADANTEFQEAYAKEAMAKCPWDDLDREEEASLEERLGISLAALTSGRSYHGTTHFLAKIKKLEKNGNKKLVEYSYELLPPEKSTSNRLRRRYTSKAFIRVSFDGNMTPELQKLFIRPLVLYDRVYYAFRRKDDNVHFVLTNDVVEADGSVRRPRPDEQERFSMSSLSDFINRIDPMRENAKNPTAKWAARIDLALSDSVPLRHLIPPENIIEIPDHISPAFDKNLGGKPPSYMDMTDGCGFANQALLDLAADYHRTGYFPTAIQVRIGGGKGILLRHPDQRENDDPIPKVWLRGSQLKIKFTAQHKDNPENRIIDLIRTSRMKVECRISSQTIINLEHNGVPAKVFCDMITDNVNEVVKWLTSFTEKDALFHLRDNIARTSNLMIQRRARESVGEARARGYRSYDKKADDEVAADIDEHVADGEDAGEEREQSKAWWRDPVSGLPSSLEETVVEFLDAGFSPMDNYVLAEKLTQVAKTIITTRFRPPKYHITTPMSCSGFIVPDPVGVLKPGEIFIRSSNLISIVDEDGKSRKIDVVTGDVLVTRYPCMLPTDIQKVKAVDYPQLHSYVDVIIFSTQGERSEASKLGGGDYDGDTAIVLFDPRIVKPFRNADPKFLDEPHDLDSHFEKNVETVYNLLERCASLTLDEQIAETQIALLGGAYDKNYIGLYSKLHSIATYKYSYDHPYTWRLAYMFCKILDGSKSGQLVKQSTKAQDCRSLGMQPPRWMEDNKKKGKLNGQSNLAPPKRTGTPFIMDLIYDHMRSQVDVALGTVNTLYGSFKENSIPDATLLGPYQEAENQAQQREKRHGNTNAQQELRVIRAYVEMCWEKSRSAIKQNFTSLPIEKRQDTLRSLSEQFSVQVFLKRLKKGGIRDCVPSACSGSINEIIEFSKDELGRIMASYLYKYDCQKKSRHFTRAPWDMAFATLCAIKAGAKGGRVITCSTYEKMTIHHSFRITQ